MKIRSRVRTFRETWDQISAIWAKAWATALATGVGFAFAIVTAAAFGQTPVANAAADPQQFAGVWKAKFKGKVFETIVLENKNGKLIGDVSRAEIQLNDDGELTSADPTEGNDPMIETIITGETLRIACKDEDGDIIRAELKLTGKDAGELQLITPPHVKPPKPWRVERAAPANPRDASQ